MRSNLCKCACVMLSSCANCRSEQTVTKESFRFEDEDEALCFRHNEIFKLFRLQLGRDDEVDCNNIVTPSLSRI